MNKRNSGAMLKQNFQSLGRVVRKLFQYYPRLAPLTVVLVLFSSAVSSIPSLFVQNVLSVIEKWYKTGDWVSAKPEIIHYLTVLGVLYLLALISLTVYTQIMAYMTQGFLDKLRREMFEGMQDLPIAYFDTHKHGDIMSHYTNDIDTLRQLVSQALPTLIQSGAIVLVVFAIMLYFSIWLTLILILGIVAMFAAYAWWGILMYGLLFGFAYLFRVYITGKIGGITGDVMGAGSELAEVLLLLMVLVIIRFWGFPLGISSRIIELCNL